MSKKEKIEELRKKFKTFESLKYELFDICQNYVERNNLRKDEMFSDFFLKNSDEVGLSFVDENMDVMGYYTTVRIEDLLED